MGTDKGLLLQNDKTWSKYIADLLNSILPEVYISLRHGQAAAYQSCFETSRMIFDQPGIPAKGPLTGILSAHKTYPDKNWFVIACDIISINEGTISRLIDSYLENPVYHACLYKNQNRFEPLCAIYSAAWLAELLASSHTLSNFSLQRNLPLNKSLILDAGVNDILTLKNYNTKMD